MIRGLVGPAPAGCQQDDRGEHTDERRHRQEQDALRRVHGLPPCDAGVPLTPAAQAYADRTWAAARQSCVDAGEARGHGMRTMTGYDGGVIRGVAR
jgi:hypothetical protein